LSNVAFFRCNFNLMALYLQCRLSPVTFNARGGFLKKNAFLCNVHYKKKIKIIRKNTTTRKLQIARLWCRSIPLFRVFFFGAITGEIFVAHSHKCLITSIVILSLHLRKKKIFFFYFIFWRCEMFSMEPTKKNSF
jgi:hypothetical protein